MIRPVPQQLHDLGFHSLERVSLSSRAEVWKALAQTGETFALKVVPGQFVDPRRREGFESWVSRLQALSPHRLPRLENWFALEGGHVLLVTGWVDHLPLSEWQIGSVQTAGAMMAMLEQLGEMAASDLAHLGVRCSNLAMSLDGRVVLFGMGTGHLLESRAEEGAAPELASGFRAEGALWRCDLYSAALVLCRVLGLEVEGAGTAVPYVRLPRSSSQQLRGLEGLRLLLEAALSAKPSQRPASISLLQRALGHAIVRTTGVGEVPQDAGEHSGALVAGRLRSRLVQAQAGASQLASEMTGAQPQGPPEERDGEPRESGADAGSAERGSGLLETSRRLEEILFPESPSQADASAARDGEAESTPAAEEGEPAGWEADRKAEPGSSSGDSEEDREGGASDGEDSASFSFESLIEIEAASAFDVPPDLEVTTANPERPEQSPVGVEAGQEGVVSGLAESESSTNHGMSAGKRDDAKALAHLPVDDLRAALEESMTEVVSADEEGQVQPYSEDRLTQEEPEDALGASVNASKIGDVHSEESPERETRVLPAPEATRSPAMRWGGAALLCLSALASIWWIGSVSRENGVVSRENSFAGEQQVAVPIAPESEVSSVAGVTATQPSALRVGARRAPGSTSEGPPSPGPEPGPGSSGSWEDQSASPDRVIAPSEQPVGESRGVGREPNVDSEADPRRDRAELARGVVGEGQARVGASPIGRDESRPPKSAGPPAVGVESGAPEPLEGSEFATNDDLKDGPNGDPNEDPNDDATWLSLLEEAGRSAAQADLDAALTIASPLENVEATSAEQERRIQSFLEGLERWRRIAGEADPRARLLTSEAMPPEHPAAGPVQRLREAAILELAAEIENSLSAGDPMAARRRLAGLEDSPGLEALRARVDAEERSRRVDEARSRLRAAMRRGQPHVGLDELATMPGEVRAELGDLVGDLESLLSRLDAAPPQLEVDRLREIDFRGDRDLDLRLRATDDYEVVAVRLFVRPVKSAQTDYQPVDVRFLGGRVFAARIPVSLHAGGPVDLYGEAEDRSGQMGLLGASRRPIKLRP